MFGASIKSIAIAAALAGAVGYGSGFLRAKAQFDVREALIEAQADLAAEERTSTRLRAEVAVERARAASANIARAEQERINLEAAARYEAMEDLLDEIYSTEGGDVPAPDLLLRAIGMRE